MNLQVQDFWPLWILGGFRDSRDADKGGILRGWNRGKLFWVALYVVVGV